MNKMIFAGVGLALAAGTVAIAAPARDSRPPLDANRDGKVSVGELQQRAVQRFRRLDGNNDGMLSLAEFTARSNARARRIDANRDGTLTREEFRAARESFRGRARASRG